jgi:solute carrier family 35 protein E1
MREEHKQKHRRLGFIYVFSWYVSTVVLLIANKTLMADEGFALPIFLTFLHTLVSFWCSQLLLLLGWRKRIKLRDQRQGLHIFVLSQSHALSILLSISSLKYVEVSFEQALSASTPAFTATLGCVILGKVERTAVWLTLIPVIGGALLSMRGEPNASPLGVFLILAANTSRALKSCFQELLLNESMVNAYALL